MSTPTAGQAELACSGCGAGLKYAPGTGSLTCPYCGAATPVPGTAGGTEELDFHAYLARLSAEEETHEVLAAHCPGCGADTTLDPNVVSDQCPFCSLSLIPASRSTRLIRPRALLPFHVTREQAEAALERWMGRLWFAPNDFRRSARREGGMAGLYIPFWTFDCRTTSRYTGQRGEHYYVTERYTTTENGKTVTRTRQVRRTRWYPAWGTVHNAFDDLLVMASESLPQKQAAALEPWDLGNLVAYSEEYLSGFRTESYRIPLDGGFERARGLTEGPIHASIRRDIGGDEQRITSVDTRYDDITFKHVLLPVWISPYRYRDRVYRRLVNARTGEVQGERPWSWVKIALLVLFVAAVAAAVFLWVEAGQAAEAPTERYGVVEELPYYDGAPPVERPSAPAGDTLVL